MKQNYQSDLNASRDEFDRLLDSALGKYAAVEPRAGLEERVLANLRAESNQRSSQAWWGWALAAALAVIAIAVGLEWRSSRAAHPVIASHPPITTQTPFDLGRGATTQASAEIAGSKHAPTRRSRAVRTPQAAVLPKLDRFPSPEPLSAQELALARYVSQFPQEATLIAQAQEEFQKEIQQKIDEVRSDAEGSGSDQQER